MLVIFFVTKMIDETENLILSKNRPNKKKRLKIGYIASLNLP